MVDVLVLNSSFEPFQITNMKKAMKLLIKERATLVKAKEGKQMHSAHQGFDTPSVIKLHQYINYKRKPIPYSKKNVIIRDRYTCQYCGATGEAMTIDHIHPKSKGGPLTWENTVACCKRCNTRKADRTLDEAGFILKKTPRKPSPFLFMKYTNSRDEWEEFLYL